MKPSSREEVWKAHYLKLVEFKEERGTTKVPRTENETLYLWCYMQRKKRRDNSPGLSEEKINLLDDIGFIWDINSTPGRGRPRKASSAVEEIKKQKAADKKGEGKKGTDIGDTDVPTSKRTKKRSSLKAIDSRESALAAAAAVAAVADESMDEDKEPNEEKPEPAAKPNVSFLEKSYGGAAWVANGARELLKMFVSF